MSDYRSDLYKALQKVQGIKKMDGTTERNIIKIFRGSDQIWPKEDVPDTCLVCCCWKDNAATTNFDVTSSSGLNTNTNWNSASALRLNVPTATDAAYVLDEYFDSTTGGHQATDPYSHVNYNMWTAESGYTPDNLHTVLGYFGSVRLSAGETIEFSGKYDDSMYVRMKDPSNTQVVNYFHNGGTGFLHTGCTYTAATTGNYAFQLLVGNRGGPAGPSSSTIAAPSGEGIRFYITKVGGTRCGPFRIGNVDAGCISQLGVRFHLPSDWTT